MTAFALRWCRELEVRRQNLSMLPRMSLVVSDHVKGLGLALLSSMYGCRACSSSRVERCVLRRRRAPVPPVFRNRLQRLGDDGIDLRVLDRAWRTGARFIEQPSCRCSMNLRALASCLSVVRTRPGLDRRWRRETTDSQRNKRVRI